MLNADWDPLGVADEVDDEYDAYVWPIDSLLRRGASDIEVADHLLSIETESMGLSGTSLEHRLTVAARLRALRLPGKEHP